MKKILKNAVMSVFAVPVILAAVTSCSWIAPEDGQSSGKGCICISFDEDELALTKSSQENIPDTGDFILTVTGPGNKLIYSGSYGASPESIMVDTGTYTVRAVSCQFTAPSFSAPQYGDEQVVIVKAGEKVDVILSCLMLNSGVRITTSPSFLTACSSSTIHVKSDDGSLLYAYSEQRIAYFRPGKVSVVMSSGASDEVLISRNLEAREVLSLTINASAPSQEKASRISVGVDTSKVWKEETYEIGGENLKGQESGDALSISQAKNAIGAKGVWVTGYIAGGDLTSSSGGISFQVPFSSATNIAIASRSSVSDKSSCMSVQLSSGSIRDALNLRDNPSNLGRKVWIKGDIVEAYYGIPGIKNISEFILK